MDTHHTGAAAKILAGLIPFVLGSWPGTGGAAAPADRPGAGSGEEPATLLVSLLPRAQVRGPFVLLEEIADLSGGPENLREHAAAILLGFAPEAGASRDVDGEEVEGRLRQSGIPEEAFRLEGAPRAIITAEAASEGTEDRSPRGAAEGPTGLRPDARADRGADRAAAPEAKSAPKTKAAGARGGKAAPRVRTVPIEEVRRSFFSGKPISDGGPPAEPRSARTAPAAGTAAGRGREASGVKARPGEAREASRGRDDPESPPFSVERGEAVTISSVGGSVIVSESGQALEAVGAGQVLQVKNLRTGRKILARLVDRGVVVPEGEGTGKKGD